MKRVIMVAHWFPPCEAWPTAAARVANFATYLPDSGWEPTLLVPDLRGGACPCESCRSGMRPADSTAFEVVRVPVRASVLRRIHHRHQRPARPGPAAAADGEGPKSPAGSWSTTDRVTELAWLLGGIQSDWPRVSRAQSGLLLQRGANALWTTSGPFEHLALGARLRREHGVPWAADLRDPASVDVVARSRSTEALVRSRRSRYRADLLQADAIIGATEQVVRLDAPWLGREIALILSGFDSGRWALARASAAPSREVFEIVFTGKIYEHYRRPDIFLRGLGIAANRLNRDDRRRLRFSYYGRDGDIVVRLAKDAGVEDLVADNGFVAPDQVPEIASSAAVLLLLTNEVGDIGVPGGKFFEYLAAHRPILAAPGADTFVQDVLAKTQAGTSASHAEDVSRQVINWFDTWKIDGHLPFHGDPKAIDSYSAAGAASRLANVLSSLSPAPYEHR